MCENSAMSGVHFSLSWRTEGSEYGAGTDYTVYGATFAEAKTWGEKEAWEFLHEDRPNDRALESMRMGPVSEELLGPDGFRPLDWDEVKKLRAQKLTGDGRRFGLGATAGFGHVGANERPDDEARLIEAATLHDLRKLLLKRVPPELTAHFSNETNWDAAATALYVITLGGQRSGDWEEVVLCEASNLYHAGQLWQRHSHAKGLPSREGGLMLANGLCTVGESLFLRRH